MVEVINYSVRVYEVFCMYVLCTDVCVTDLIEKWGQFLPTRWWATQRHQAGFASLTKDIISALMSIRVPVIGLPNTLVLGIGSYRSGAAGVGDCGSL
jgi:hypothetical protein